MRCDAPARQQDPPRTCTCGMHAALCAGLHVQQPFLPPCACSCRNVDAPLQLVRFLAAVVPQDPPPLRMHRHESPSGHQAGLPRRGQGGQPAGSAARTAGGRQPLPPLPPLPMASPLAAEAAAAGAAAAAAGAAAADALAELIAELDEHAAAAPPDFLIPLVAAPPPQQKQPAVQDPQWHQRQPAPQPQQPAVQRVLATPAPSASMQPAPPLAAAAGGRAGDVDTGVGSLKAMLEQRELEQAMAAFVQADTGSPESMLSPLRKLLLAGHGGQLLKVRHCGWRACCLCCWQVGAVPVCACKLVNKRHCLLAAAASLPAWPCRTS